MLPKNYKSFKFGVKILKERRIGNFELGMGIGEWEITHGKWEGPTGKWRFRNGKWKMRNKKW